MDKKIIYGLVGIVVVVGTLWFFVGKNSSIKQINTPTPQTSQTPTSVSAIIVKAVTSRSIDTKGNATGVTTTFDAKTDKIVYVVLTLKNATKNTKLSYVRYLNSKYIDSKVAEPNKDGITNFYFTFEKGIGDYPKGTYNVKLYVDGNYITSVTYVFN